MRRGISLIGTFLQTAVELDLIVWLHHKPAVGVLSSAHTMGTRPNRAPGFRDKRDRSKYLMVRLVVTRASAAISLDYLADTIFSPYFDLRKTRKTLRKLGNMRNF